MEIVFLHCLEHALKNFTHQEWCGDVTIKVISFDLKLKVLGGKRVKLWLYWQRETASIRLLPSLKMSRTAAHKNNFKLQTLATDRHMTANSFNVTQEL